MSTEPAGTVTFLFTDIEGSTRLARQLGDRRYSETLAEHRRILRDAITASAGQEVDTQGDGFFIAFRSATDAIRSALAAQQAIRAHPWPAGTSLRVRMGLHTSVPVSAEGRYVGVGVHRAARICQASQGGQVLLSQTTADLVEGDLPNGASLRDLGEYRLKDMIHPERLLQLVAPGLTATFPAVRAVGVRTSRLRAAGFAAALVAAAVALILIRSNLTGPGTRIDSLAVLPLENLSRDPAQEYLSDGLTEELISTLGQVGSIRVISRTSVMQYKGAKKSAPQIARELGVDALVEGSVLRSGSRIRVTAQLVHAATDRHLWSRSYERDLRDVIALQNEVARAIAGEIRARLAPGEAARLGVARKVDPEAHEAYLRGLYELNKPETPGILQAAIAQFERAVERDPQHALAWAGMASAYGTLSLYPDAKTSPPEYWAKAKAAGLTAVQIDPTLAEAHASLAQAALFSKEYAAAEEGFRKALELNPNSAPVNQSYAVLLLFLGRMPEAVQQIQRTHELDPLNITTSALVANWLFFARRYVEALTQIRKVLEIEPNFALAHSFFGRILIEQGMLREGVAEVRKAEGLGMTHPWHQGFIGRAYVLMGNTLEAQKILAQLKEAAKTNPFADAAQSIIYAALGEEAQAIAALERGFRRGDSLDVLRTAPWWDPLRSDPRFKALERAVYGGK